MSGSMMISPSPATLPAGPSTGQSALLPVAIDYPAALALHQMALVQDELQKYLLAPEVNALLHYVPDLHRKTRKCLRLMWRRSTGCSSRCRGLKLSR